LPAKIYGGNHLHKQRAGLRLHQGATLAVEVL